MKRILGLLLACCLMLGMAMPAMAATVSDDPKVQGAYDALMAMQTGLEEKNFDAIKEAQNLLATTTRDMDETQEEEWNLVVAEQVGRNEYISIVVRASYVTYAAECRDVFLETPNMLTALDLVYAYEETCAMGLPIEEILPGITEVYAAAADMAPSEEVVAIKEVFMELKDLMEWGWGDLNDALATVDTVMEDLANLTEEDLEDLAMLMEQESGADVVAYINALVQKAKDTKDILDACDAFWVEYYKEEAERDEEALQAAAQAFVDAIDAYDAAYDGDLSAVEAFYFDIADTYQEALAILEQLRDGTGAETGDSSWAMFAMVLSAAMAGVLVFSRRRCARRA